MISDKLHIHAVPATTSARRSSTKACRLGSAPVQSSNKLCNKRWHGYSRRGAETSVLPLKTWNLTLMLIPDMVVWESVAAPCFDCEFLLSPCQERFQKYPMPYRWIVGATIANVWMCVPDFAAACVAGDYTKATVIGITGLAYWLAGALTPMADSTLPPLLVNLS